MLTQKEFRKELNRELESRLTLEHPILTKLEAGQRDISLIRLMALQGYQLTKMFARYIAGLYYHCPDPTFQRRLAINLYEEETGKLSQTDSHLELMRQFIFALGIMPEELEAAQPLPETEELIEYRRKIVEDPLQFHKAAAAVMIASEGQNLEKKAGKLRHELLPAEYGLTEQDLTFFIVHAAEDVYHVKDGLDLVSKICKTEKMQQEAINAIHETCDRFWSFYDGIQKAYN